MARPAPKPFAQLAAVLFILALLAWGWSYLPSSFHTESRGGQIFLIYSDGAIASFDSSTPDFHGYESMVDAMRGQASKDRQWHGLGFELIAGEWPKFLPDSGGGAVMLPYVVLIVPYWSVVGVAGLLLIAALWRVRRVRKLEHAGCCTACGYDLRFSRDRCPECGSMVESTS
jgi:hypothetical protein